VRTSLSAAARCQLADGIDPSYQKRAKGFVRTTAPLVKVHPRTHVINASPDVTTLAVISSDAMKTVDVINALGALAHEYRLAIYRLLVEQGPQGLPAGAIGEKVGLVPSSLTFHLQSLQRAGLITQLRASRQLIYSADFGVMNELVGYLTDKCCSASGESCATDCKPVRVAKPVRRRNAA
jgi:ArsR family transcriptional regulator, arsenate/arsenite/antimonite-responsive transcriptional repressor